MKVCKKCGRELDESCFYRNKRMKDGLQLYCKPCFDEMLRATKARHKKSVGTSTGDRGVLTAHPTAPRGLHRIYSNPQLAGFSPRELIEELKARGYTGELKYTQTIKL